MAVQIQCVEGTYSLSGHFATVTMTFQLLDDAILDASGNPKILDQKTISVTQNMLAENAKDVLKQKILDEVDDYLQKAKANIDTIYTMFGTIDPDQIMELIKQDIQTDIANLVQTYFPSN